MIIQRRSRNSKIIRQYLRLIILRSHVPDITRPVTARVSWEGRVAHWFVGSWLLVVEGGVECCAGPGIAATG